MAEERVFDPVLDPVPADLTNNHKNFGDLPARPFWSDEARWIPKLATVGCLGLTYWRARQNMGLKGTSALAFPLFGTDAKERLFALYMAGNLTSPLMIWTLEQLGAKKTNEAWRIQQALNFVTSFILGTALTVSGVARTAPLYFFDLIVMIKDTSAHSPASITRKIDPDVARAVLPATLVGHVIPSLLMGILPMTFTGVSRSRFAPQSIVCRAFLYSPLTVPILTYGLATLRRWNRESANENAPVHQRIEDHEADESYTVGGRINAVVLKEAYSDLFSVQAAGHVLAVASLGLQAWRKLPELGINPGASVLTKASAMLGWILEPMSFMRFEILPLYAAATASFGLYVIWEVRRKGYTTTRDASKAAVGFVAGNILVGPGASYAGLWMWREDVLGKVRSLLYR